jgi:hypothetical protein
MGLQSTDHKMKEEKGRVTPKVVLFDLDNVLYRSPKLAEETEKLISAFFRQQLGFEDEQEIEAQKKRYFDQYGLVLKGLLKDHPDRTTFNFPFASSLRSFRSLDGSSRSFVHCFGGGA